MPTPTEHRGNGQSRKKSGAPDARSAEVILAELQSGVFNRPYKMAAYIISSPETLLDLEFTRNPCGLLVDRLAESGIALAAVDAL